MILVEADVLIELQRKRPGAIVWAQSNPMLNFSVPGVAAIELVIGSRNKTERDRARKFLDMLNILWMNEQDHSVAYGLVHTYGLSSGLSLADFLIAGQAISRGATLYTFNVKHFGSIDGLHVQEPYPR